MKYCALTLFCSLVCSMGWAQSSATSTYVTDINGRTMEASSVTTGNGGSTEHSRSINGRVVPVDRVQTKVIREDSNGKVTETIIQKFDATGQPYATEKVIKEETKSASGSTVTATTYVSDSNGRMQEAERKTTETRIQGANQVAETVVARPSINGSFQPVEKRSKVTETSGPAKKSDETVYKRSAEGQFYQALREVSDQTAVGNQVTESVATYAPNSEGRMQLANQRVSTTTKRSGGEEVTEVNLYARAADGAVQDNEARQQIKEQQIIERLKGPDGSVIEKLSVRRPSLGDPNRLGGVQKLSETICKGECTPASKP